MMPWTFTAELARQRRHALAGAAAPAAVVCIPVHRRSPGPGPRVERLARAVRGAGAALSVARRSPAPPACATC
ncbi:MAG: hypothetical protein ACRD03_09025 [Acidimicrobiales bacterium]